MHRSEILEEAKRLTNDDRLKSYGDPLVNHANIALGWEVILGCDVSPHQVALCMAWLKIARLKCDSENTDCYVDGAAYMALAGELKQRQDEPFTGVLVPESNVVNWPGGIFSPAVTILPTDAEEESYQP